jgi:membrane-associated phospholipid phosphatase
VITTRLKQWLVVREISLYLLFGFLLSLVSLWVLWSVAEDVYENDPIVEFDVALANELHAQATPTSTTIYFIISYIGGQGSLIVGGIVAAVFIVRRQWSSLTFWVITLVGGYILNPVLKNLVARPRPTFTDPFFVEMTYSFPSGHAMISLITFGMFAYFLWLAIPNRYARILISFVSTLLIILVGISRMTLGVHYFSDVVAGFAAGGIWLGVCILVHELFRRKQAQLRANVAPLPYTSQKIA